MPNWILLLTSITLMGSTSSIWASDATLCSLLRLEIIPIGTICKSKDGFDFQLVGRDFNSQHPQGSQAWKDVTSGLVWHGIRHEPGTQFEAYTYCNLDEGKSLPTKKDFETAQLHGFREILTFPNEKYWSSSVDPKYKAIAFAYNGSEDFVFSDPRSIPMSFQCISR